MTPTRLRSSLDRPAGEERETMAANINRVVLVGNLTRDPELRHTPSRHGRLQPAHRGQHAPQGRRDRRVDREAELLRHHRLGQPGRELRAVPLEGPPRRDRRPPRVARVGRTGRHEAPGGRDHRRHACSSSAAATTAAAVAAAATSSCPRARRAAPTPTSRAPTTTFRSKERSLGSTEEIRSRPQLGGSRKRTAPSGPGRRKSCFFCKSKVDEIDYKNVNELRRYVSEKGKIRSRRISGACRRHQRQVAVAVKRAREIALLPYVGDK